jgi:hypothetical protein
MLRHWNLVQFYIIFSSAYVAVSYLSCYFSGMSCRLDQLCAITVSSSVSINLRQMVCSLLTGNAGLC